jgi:hypothetical protein
MRAISLPEATNHNDGELEEKVPLCAPHLFSRVSGRPEPLAGAAPEPVAEEGTRVEREREGSIVGLKA